MQDSEDQVRLQEERRRLVFMQEPQLLKDLYNNFKPSRYKLGKLPLYKAMTERKEGSQTIESSIRAM